MSTEKYQVLETITAVSRLIMLVFKPLGTKIAIREHKIVLCDKSEGTYFYTKYAQGLNRYFNGDSRDDIYVLNSVIYNFIEWYIVPYKDKNHKLYDGMIKMAQYLCIGLKKLQKTYDTGIIVLTLQYYITVLMAVINDTYYNGMIFISKPNQNAFLDETDSFDDNENDDDDEVCYSTIFDIDKFKNFWTIDELLNLCDQFNNCFKSHNNSVVEDSKDTDSIDEDSNSDIVDKEKTKIPYILPIPRKKNSPIVIGHLAGIKKILDTMDRKFTGILNQSIKGTK